MADALTPDELADVVRFVHRVEHLRWRKTGKPVDEGSMVVECWMLEEAPEWARKLAASGAPGSLWCPQIDPSLRTFGV